MLRLFRFYLSTQQNLQSYVFNLIKKESQKGSLEKREKTKPNLLDYFLTSFTIIPITLELIRLFYFPDSKNFENIVFYTLISGVFASLIAITFQTSLLRSKYSENVIYASEFSNIIFTLIFFSLLVNILRIKNSPIKESI